MSDTIPPCLSVVMPCYNEAGTVREIVKRVLDNHNTAELIIVPARTSGESPDKMSANRRR